MTKVKTAISHDRMSLKATFKNGDVLQLNLSRGGERWKCTQPAANVSITQAEFNKFAALCKWVPGEKTNAERFARIQAVLEATETVQAL